MATTYEDIDINQGADIAIELDWSMKHRCCKRFNESFY